MREHLLKTKCKLINTENKLADTSNQLAKVAKDVSKSGGRVTVGDIATGLGRSQFISNEDLHRAILARQYLKDDCLFFQVTKLIFKLN